MGRIVMHEQGEQPTAPNMRSFSLDSEEAYEALCEPRERAWTPNGSLPRDPRPLDQTVQVDVERR
jgi:hypothetical protein